MEAAKTKGPKKRTRKLLPSLRRAKRAKETKEVKDSKVTKTAKVAEATGPKEAYAVGRYLRISPTKVRGVLNLVQGETVAEARRILRFSPKKGATVALKVLNSAVANAKAKGHFDEKSLIVSDARADKGPLFRRKMDPKARGARGMISTPSTHLKIVVRQEPAVSGQEKKIEKLSVKEVSKSSVKRDSVQGKETKSGS